MGRPSKDTQPYLFEQFSRDALTVSVVAFIADPLRQIIDLRAGTSQNLFKNLLPSLQPSARRLHELGFDYIDIGIHADWLAAEIPFKNNPNEALLHAAGKILVELQKILSNG